MTLQPPPPSRYPGADSYERQLQRIRLRQDTEENWLKNDPVPASGEMCYTIGSGDAGQVLKVGDGTRKWSELPYLMAQGNSGAPGPAGADGHSVTVYGPSLNPPAPTVTQLFKGDIWLSDGLYAKNPSFDASLITPGAKGDQGDAATIDKVSAVQLPTGTQPTINNVGDTHHAQFVFGIPEGGLGPQGIQGIQGPPGPKGPAGDTFKISGAVADAASLPAAPANLSVYITQDNSHLHIYDTASAAAGPNGYVDLGAIAGPQGASTYFSAPVAKAADLPAVGAAGQAILSLDDGHMHSWDVTSGTWTDAGQIRGPSGSGISDGAADGQVPVWSVTFHSWIPTLLKLSGLDDVTFASAPITGAVLTYDIDHWIAAKPKLEDCDDVESYQQEDGSALEDADILHYDLASGKWKAIGIRDYLQAEVELANLGDCTISGGSTPTDGQVLTWDNANLVWTNASLPPSVTSLSALTDVDVATAPPVAGQALVWSATVSKWVPGDVAGASPIVYLGTGAWDSTAALDGTAPMYGMPVGTTPSPIDYPPIPGDSYVDLATGMVTTFTGAVTTKRTGGAITGGGGSLDIVRERLQDLDDVSLSAVANDDVLHYDSATSKWANKAIDAYTKSQTDQKLSNLVSSIEHEEAVLSIASTPPGGPQTGDLHIVGAAGTGAWAGQDNNLARWTGSSWSFETPRSNESHLVEDVGEIWHWNGTAWVKIATAVAGSSARSGVGEIIAWMHGTIPAEYLPCDGRVVAISSYSDLHAIIGNTYNAGTAADGTTTFALPDLRGYFLRGSGTNRDGTAGTAVGQKQGQATARPGTAFTTDSQGNHHHTVRTTTPSDLAAGWHSVSGSAFMGHRSTNSNSYDINTGDNGAHTHTITGGGDTETRPKNIGVTWVIRWKAINGGAAGPKGEAGPSADAGSLYMVGDIKQSLLSEPQFKALLPIAEQAKWVLADGRDVTGSAYASAVGSNKIPDLRGAFLRMAGTNSNPQWVGPSLRGYQEDSTARPKTAFTTDSQGGHYHSGGVPGNTTAGSYAAGTNNQITVSGSRGNTGTAGAHTHTITGGGDTETRPKSFGVNYFIKIN